MNRATSTFIAARFIAVATVATVTAGLALAGLAAPAGAIPAIGGGRRTTTTTTPGSSTPGSSTPGSSTPAGPQCKGTLVKPVVHTDAVRREGALTTLVTRLTGHDDPFGVNAAQIAALQSADTAITALDAQIASTCYPTLAALHADASKLFVDYRVYWLRVPQTYVIDAADQLAEASTRLSGAAAKLAPLVGSNATAQADLAAMNQALAGAVAKIGTPPALGPNLAAVPALAPAPDMSHDTSVLEAAYPDLLAAKAALVQARADGLKVVADLQH